MLGCLDEDQTLGDDADSGASLPDHDSGVLVFNRDSGTVKHHDSGAAVVDQDSGKQETADTGDGRDVGVILPSRDAGAFDTGAIPAVDSGSPGDTGSSPGDSGAPSCPATPGTTGTILASGQTDLAAFAIDTGNVYWTAGVILNTAGNVLTLPKTGGTPTTLATNQPSALSLTTTSTSLFWSSSVGSLSEPANNFSRVMDLSLPPVAGAAPKQFWGTSNLESSYPFALTADSTALYWYDLGTTVVVAAPLDGASPVTFANPGPAANAVPAGLAVHASTLYTLWFGSPAVGTLTLLSAPTTGGAWSTLWSSPVGTSYINGDLAADATGVYWVDQAEGAGTATASIWSMPTGGAPTKLVSGLNQPIALVVDGVNIYYDDDFNIWKMPIAGGTPTVVAPNEYAGVIAVDATNLYWVNGCFGTIKKLAK